MRRRLVAVFLSVCVVCFLIAAGCMGAGALQARPLDVGNYNDYGGGNYGGGYNGGNYGGDYGGDYGGGVIFFGGDDDGDGSGGGGIGIVVGMDQGSVYNAAAGVDGARLVENSPV